MRLGDDPVTATQPVNPHLDLSSYEPAADLMALNMGPQHPSTHGVFRIKLFIDGEDAGKAQSLGVRYAQGEVSLEEASRKLCKAFAQASE